MANSARPIEVDLTCPQATNIEVVQNTAPMRTSQGPPEAYISSSPSALPQYSPNSPNPPPPNSQLTCHLVTTRVYGDMPEVESVSNGRDELEISNGHGGKPTDPVWDAEKQTALVLQTREHMGYHLPPRFTPDPQTSGAMIQFIMSQYESLFELVFFRPMKEQVKTLRGQFVARVLSSKITHWSMYTGAQMFRALRQNGEHADVERFTPLIDRLSQISITSKDDVNLDDLTGRLSGALELALLKHLTSSAKSSYTLLQHIAPLFMQVAFADPMLWPRDPSSSGISLSHVFTSPSYDLGRFVFIDATITMLYGTPPLIEYDTSYPIKRLHGVRTTNWAHGWPQDFVFSTLKISQWRAQHPNGCSNEKNPWREIEADTLAWRPKGCYDTQSESLQVVMSFAAQEIWRHTLLLYLYLGMRGVTSHDPWVQFSVQQISRLHATINPQFTTEMHLMVPFLLAGACAPGEVDRKKFRTAVSESGRMKTWLLKPVNFEYVLDHLWHGVGANGGAVTWDDYVRSRKAIIDIGV